jgi:hypothetical protein
VIELPAGGTALNPAVVTHLLETVFQEDEVGIRPPLRGRLGVVLED